MNVGYQFLINSKNIVMSQQPQLKQSDVVKVIERQNVISYKKKPKLVKDVMKSQNNYEDQDNISAQSLQTGAYSQDVSRLRNKMNPLPQLGKEKKRFITKNLLTQQLRINNYQQKQVRQHDNLMLKQKNNYLSSENMKLKTKISTLEKENLKLQRMVDQQPGSKSKTLGLGITKQRFRSSGDNLSTKILVKSLKKQLEDIKKENQNIKSSIKFTTISELECERDAIIEQTARLRTMLEQQLSKRISLRVNQQGMSHLQQRLASSQDRNGILMRENNQLKNKLKNFQQGQNKLSRTTQGQKSLNKVLYNIRRLLKQKQKQVQQLREQIKTDGSVQSIALTSDKNVPSQQLSNLSNQRRPSAQRPNPIQHAFQKRIASKSAQKGVSSKPSSKKAINNSNGVTVSCQNCKKLQGQVQQLKNKLVQYESQLQNANPLILSLEPVERPKQQEKQALVKFIEYRFKAHHLTLQESEKYLLNVENISEEQLRKEVNLDQFMESLVTEPFVVLSKRYIEVFLMEVCYRADLEKGLQRIQLSKETKITKKAILENYKKLMPPFDLLPQSKQEQMFLQIAQLVTSYYQQILAAMSNRKNGQGTISQKDMTEFFTQIQLEKDYIEFIVTQIILESIDLQRLNYFAFFQIFYMPQEEGSQGYQQGQLGKKLVTGAPVDRKKRFQVDQVVKEQDEQYEQSRSYVDASRQKTSSRHQGQSLNDQHNQLYEDNQEQPADRKYQPQAQDEQQPKNQNSKKQEEQQYGQQQYEQQNQGIEQNKSKQGPEYSKFKQGPEYNKSKQGPEQNKFRVDHIKSKEGPTQIFKPTSVKQKSKRQHKQKKSQKEESYAEQFQQQKMNQQQEQESAQQEQDQHRQQIQNKSKTSKPIKLIEKLYQIEDIQDQYNQEFQN